MRIILNEKMRAPQAALLLVYAFSISLLLCAWPAALVDARRHEDPLEEHRHECAHDGLLGHLDRLGPHTERHRNHSGHQDYGHISDAHGRKLQTITYNKIRIHVDSSYMDANGCVREPRPRHFHRCLLSACEHPPSALSAARVLPLA